MSTFKLMCLLSCSLPLGAQINLKLELPLMQDVASLGVVWAVGDYAVYEVFGEEDLDHPIGEHRISIKEITVVDGEPHYRVEVLRIEEGRQEGVAFLTPVRKPHLNVKEVRDFRAHTAYGSLEIGSVNGSNEETITNQEKAQATCLGKTWQVVHFVLEQGERPAAAIWVRPEFGPYGLCRGVFWRGAEMKHYVLADYRSHGVSP